MVTHQLQVERRTRKERRSKSDVLPTVPCNQLWRYLVSFARYSDLLVENHGHFIPHLYLAHRRDYAVGISWICLMLIKLEWLGYRMVKKLWQYVKPFSSNTGTLRTDGRTDRQTEFLYQYRASVCWRAIKMLIIEFQMCWYVPNFIKSGRFYSEIWRFNDLQYGRRQPSWIFEI